MIDPRHWIETPDFKRAWWMTEAIPGSFTKLNAAAYYALGQEVPRNGLCIEVGVDQGRSVSMLLQALYKRTAARVLLVDSWHPEVVIGPNRIKVEKMLKWFEDDSQLKIEVMHMSSEKAGMIVDDGIDLLHIDADHYHPNVDVDYETWLPKVKVGGYAALHDVKATFKDVDECVEKYLTSSDSWKFVGLYDCLAVWRRL